MRKREAIIPHTCWGAATTSHLFGRTGDSCSYDGDVLANHIISAPLSIMSSSIQQLLFSEHVIGLITRSIAYNLCNATLTDLPAAISGQDEYLYTNLESQIYEGYQSLTTLKTSSVSIDSLASKDPSLQGWKDKDDFLTYEL